MNAYHINPFDFVSVRLNLLHGIAALLLTLPAFLPPASAAAGTAEAKPSAIPLDQLGATVEKQYTGNGLAVRPTKEGALWRCVFQKLEGEVTRQGLWLTSTAGESKGERFRVVATAVGRTADVAQPSRLRVNGVSSPRSVPSDEMSPELAGEDACATSAGMLPRTGTVEVVGHVARFIRPGLVEEYTVSVDGVRQDFIITQRPGGPACLPDRQGQLRVDLAVEAAKVEPLVNGVRPVRYALASGEGVNRPELSHGARLVLEGSGRKLNYDRLRVTDATGKELPARMEVQSSADFQSISIEQNRRGPRRFSERGQPCPRVSLNGAKLADKAVRAPLVAAPLRYIRASASAPRSGAGGVGGRHGGGLSGAH